MIKKELSKVLVNQDEFGDLVVNSEFNLCLFTKNEIFGLESVHGSPTYIGKVKCKSLSGIVLKILV